ncbi:MAG: tetratricopeptide repeat protein [Gemmatimonadaceae bacterium]
MKFQLAGAAIASAIAIASPISPARALPTSDLPRAVASMIVSHANIATHSPLSFLALDPADSLYRAARAALTNGDYDNAARMFHDIGTRYPKSTLLPDAMYYEAFAQYRSGNTGSMRSAHETLASLLRRFPNFGNRSDAATLSTRICGELAKQGDASCAATIAAQASSTAVSVRNERSASGACPAEDNDERVAALNALLQMDADRAEPILEKVLARRDECSASLRRKAVFLVAQKQSPQAADVLLRVAQSDPDAEVRSQAVFWMSQVPGDRSVRVLSQILEKSTDTELRKKALFALSQSSGAQGSSVLRTFAADASQPVPLRETAIFWLGQQKEGVQNAAYLRDLYGKINNDALKDKILFSVSQGKQSDRSSWLMQIAQRSTESMDLRKKALFYAGQAGTSMSELVKMYDQLPAGELREQMIFVFSQSSDPVALDKLISIAKSDKDADSRKKALFWLGQSHDPRAMKALTEVIDR